MLGFWTESERRLVAGEGKTRNRFYLPPEPAPADSLAERVRAHAERHPTDPPALIAMTFGSSREVVDEALAAPPELRRST